MNSIFFNDVLHLTQEFLKIIIFSIPIFIILYVVWILILTVGIGWVVNLWIKREYPKTTLGKLSLSISSFFALISFLTLIILTINWLNKRLLIYDLTHIVDLLEIWSILSPFCLFFYLVASIFCIIFLFLPPFTKKYWKFIFGKWLICIGVFLTGCYVILFYSYDEKIKEIKIDFSCNCTTDNSEIVANLPSKSTCGIVGEDCEYFEYKDRGSDYFFENINKVVLIDSWNDFLSLKKLIYADVFENIKEETFYNYCYGVIPVDYGGLEYIRKETLHIEEMNNYFYYELWNWSNPYAAVPMCGWSRLYIIKLRRK